LVANVEIAGQLDGVWRQADLLVCLTQRRRGEIGVAGVATAAGKGDLAGVAAQVGAPAREHDVRRLRRCGDEQRHEHGRERLLTRRSASLRRAPVGRAC
jgi:hypothetical protein